MHDLPDDELEFRKYLQDEIGPDRRHITYTHETKVVTVASFAECAHCKTKVPILPTAPLITQKARLEDFVRDHEYCAPLKPCPFCGDQAEVKNEGLGWKTHCTNCYAAHPDYYTTAADSIAVWNQRLEPKEKKDA
jgi:hypothetical protein